MSHRPDLRETAKVWRKLLYSRILNIFSYDNLPEEINEMAFKLFLFYSGKIIFYKIGDKFLVQPFAYTDKLDWYYIPKFGRVVNPWLPIGHQNMTFEVDKEAVVFNCTPDIYNFKEHSLVSDLIYKTSYQLAENDISYYCIQRNHRLIAIFTAENDIQKAECNRILERIYEGYPDVTMGEDLVSHIGVNPIAMNSTRSSITELVEFQQYILANFYHSFGINSNYNLKREQLNSSEIDVNKSVLRLNVEDMLKCREKGVEKINEKFGLDIRVSLNEEVFKELLEASEDGFGATELLGVGETGQEIPSSDVESDKAQTQEGETEGISNEEKTGEESETIEIVITNPDSVNIDQSKLKTSEEQNSDEPDKEVADDEKESKKDDE